MREADEDAIDELLEEEFAAANAGDVERLLSLRTAEAMEILPGALPLVGRDAIRIAWSLDTDVVERITNRSIEDITIAGDWAFARFSFTQTSTPVAGGEPTVYSCQAMLIVRRQTDRSWKIHWEMANVSDTQE